MATTDQDRDQEQSTDEKFRALMEGLRTTLPGITVLLGFLMILPFQSSFQERSGLTEALYLSSFVFAALASVLLIAPAVHQRVRAPFSGLDREHESHVRAAVRVAIVGTVCLGIAIVTSSALVASAVKAGWWTTGGVATIAAALFYTWFWQPLVVFAGDGRSDDDG